MLSPGLRRQARRVSGEKGERGFRIAAIFGQVEMHPAYQIPGRVTALEEFLQRAAGFGKLGAERLPHALPQRGENLGW